MDRTMDRSAPTAAPSSVPLGTVNPHNAPQHWSDRQACVTYEFADLESWAVWRSNDTVAEVWDEAKAYMDNLRAELWGPSPVMPDPVRPGS